MNFELFSSEIMEKSKEKMNVYMDVLIDIAMIARNLADENIIDIDYSSEMYGTLRDIADEFANEHFSSGTVDKAAHFAKLRGFAEKKLIEAFAPKLTYCVDVSYTECGHIYVEASSEEQAVILAKREIEAKGRDAIEPDEDVNVRPDDIQCINEVYCID